MNLSKITPKQTISYFVGMALIISALNIFVSAVEDVHARITPVETYFYYKKTESQESEYLVNTPYIMMQSFSQWKKESIYASWVDSLYCEFGDEHWIFIGNQESSGIVYEKTLAPGSWLMRVKMPPIPARCKVRSGISVTVRDFEKKQTIESNIFNIVTAN